MGVLFALGALISWGVGDFLIQRSTRKFGDGIALFFITAIGAIALLPLVWSDIPGMFTVSQTGLVLWATSLVMLAAALLDFEALRIGKISVIEPVYSFEIAVAALLGVWLLHERLSPQQIALIAVLMVGIFLVSMQRLKTMAGRKLERGVLMAIAATVMMGAMDVTVGIGARQTNPLIINWFISAFVAIVMAGYLTVFGEWSHIRRQWHTNTPLIISVGFMDNIAWIFFAYSVLTIPVAITTAISESYIVLASLLGLWLNRERLRRHQIVGLIVAAGAAVFLALTL